jgi:hypothetical protein
MIHASMQIHHRRHLRGCDRRRPTPTKHGRLGLLEVTAQSHRQVWGQELHQREEKELLGLG